MIKTEVVLTTWITAKFVLCFLWGYNFCLLECKAIPILEFKRLGQQSFRRNSYSFPVMTNFLSPQDFVKAQRMPAQEPSWEDMEAMHRTDLFEGDIAGVPVNYNYGRVFYDDYSRIFQQTYNTALNLDTYPDKVWIDGRVPYELDESLTDDERTAVAQAFEEYRLKTCVRFVPRFKQDVNYVFITKNLDSGCSSYVGRAGGNQTLSLEVKKCFKKGIIAHELMHTLGFFHEHSRPDRDKFVNIIEENIKPGMLRNFEMYPTKIIDTLAMPYDYDSVMHYHKLAFSRNGFPTILPRNSDAEIGQRIRLSKIDAAKINSLYKCEELNTWEKKKSTIDIPPTTIPVTTTSPTTTTSTTQSSTTTTTTEQSTTTSTPSPTTPSTTTSGSTATETTEEFSLSSSSPLSSIDPVNKISSASSTSSTSTQAATSVTPVGTIESTNVYATSSSTSNLSTKSTDMQSSTSGISSTNKSSTSIGGEYHACEDRNDHCALWADIGHCRWSEKYMTHYCRKSCRICSDDTEFPFSKRISQTSKEASSEDCQDKNLFCNYWSRIGECKTESKFMKLFCSKSCELC